MEQRKNIAKLTKRAQELRKNATKQENHLWYDFLRNYPVKFRRQTTIHAFIVDFYCPTVRLVIELDGSQHFTEDGLAYDAERDYIIKQYGCKILRFSNYDIDSSFDGVCDLIDREVKRRMVELKEE